MEVGICELRAQLSRWVRRARAGEEIIVTDRGKPIARLVSVAGERKIDRLIREGVVIPAPRRWRGPLPKPIEVTGSVTELVLDNRR